MSFYERAFRSVGLGVLTGALCALIVACVSALLFFVPAFSL